MRAWDPPVADVKTMVTWDGRGELGERPEMVKTSPEDNVDEPDSRTVELTDTTDTDDGLVRAPVSEQSALSAEWTVVVSSHGPPVNLKVMAVSVQWQVGRVRTTSATWCIVPSNGGRTIASLVMMLPRYRNANVLVMLLICHPMQISV